MKVKCRTVVLRRLCCKNVELKLANAVFITINDAVFITLYLTKRSDEAIWLSLVYSIALCCISASEFRN